MAEIGIMKKLTIGGSTYTIPEYNLPIASDSTLGGVKIGTGLSINSTTGVLSATGLDYDEADPVFVASAAYGITQNDIDSWNAKVSDDKTWNGVTLAKQQTTNTGDGTYVPLATSTSPVNISFTPVKKTPTANAIAKYDASAYLYSTTPSASDNSTKVATTAYVDGAISQKISGVLTYKGTKASVADVIAISNPSTGDVWNVTADGSEYAYDGENWQELGTAVDLSGYALKSEIPVVSYPVTSVNNKTGAVVLTASDVGALPDTTVIPTVPTNISAFTNDSGYITSYTDEKLKWTASTSSNTYYPLQSTSTGTTGTANTLNSVSFYQYYNTAGGYRRLILGNATAWKSSSGAYGTIRLYGAAATYYGDLVPGVLGTASEDGHLTANRTWTLPNKTGTVALTSDIPTVPTNISAFTNDSGYITSADVPEGASAYTGTISAVTSGNASAGSNNGFARGDHVHNITKTTINTVLGTGSGTTKFYREDGTWATPAYIANTDEKLKLAALSTSGTYYMVLSGASTTAETKYYDERIAFGRTDASDVNIAIGKNGSTKGSIRLYTTTSGKYGIITPGTLSTTQTYTLPNKTGTVALTSDIPSVPTTAASSTTGITASTTANKTTVGSSSTDYGVKSAGSGSFTQGSFSGGSFTQGTDSFTANVPTKIDTTKFNAGSYSHSGFSGGSGSFTQGSFTGGSLVVTSHVLSFTPATHGADSHTHTAATYGTDSFTAPSLGNGFYTAGTAASFTQGEDSFTPATHGADSHTHTAPTLGSKVPAVSTASATVTITDNGHTHTLS